MTKQAYHLEERLPNKSIFHISAILLFFRQYRRDERSELSSIFVTGIKTAEKKSSLGMVECLVLGVCFHSMFDVGRSSFKATPWGISHLRDLYPPGTPFVEKTICHNWFFLARKDPAQERR